MAKVVSVIFHPLLLNAGLILMVYLLNPYAFRINEEKELGVFFIMTGVIILLFPAVAILLMWKLGMIKSIVMDDKSERIGPLIAVMTCYIWFFINVNSSVIYPRTLTIIALGSCIAAGLGFFINNFTKISLHAIGAGGFLTGVLLIAFNFKTIPIRIPIPLLGTYEVSTIFVVLLTIFIAGLIGSSRLILKAHTSRDIYGGYITGSLAFLLAFRLLI